MAEASLFVELELQRARWEELDALLRSAKQCESGDRSCVSICRAAVVFACAHFEGSIKAVSRAIIEDAIDGGPFSNLPAAMKLRYVQEIMLGGPSSDKRIASAIVEKLDAGDFNPAPTDICRMFSHDSHIAGETLKKWGKYFNVDDLLGAVRGSKLEDIFEGNVSDCSRVLSYFSRSCLNGAKSFPYKFGFLHNSNWRVRPLEHSKTNANESLYVQFLEDVFSKRHRVAHGADLGAISDVKSIESDVLKMRLLVFAYAAIAGEGISAQYGEK